MNPLQLPPGRNILSKGEKVKVIYIFFICIKKKCQEETHGTPLLCKVYQEPHLILSDIIFVQT